MKKYIYALINKKKLQIKEKALSEERLPLKVIEEMRFERLRKLLHHAYENVTLYRKKFDSVGIKPEDIKSQKDIKKIPYTTKEELRAGFPDQVVASNLDLTFCQYKETSGSSGKPLAFYVDQKMFSLERESLFRMQNAMGLDFGEIRVRMRSADIRYPGFYGLLQKQFGNTKHISTVDMNASNMEKYVSFIIRNKPSLIESFPHHILSLVQYMEEKGLHVQCKLIHIVGGSISDFDRMRLKKIFGAEIYQDYGSSECMRVAYQCEQRRKYHIEMTRFVVEVIRGGRDAKIGEPGEIVLTNLGNYIMPFIRYRIMDVGVKSTKCSCGRTFNTLDRIIGRVRQTLFLPGGRLLDANSLNKMITPFHKYIKDFQTVLTKEKELKIDVVLTEDHPENLLVRLKESIDEYIKGEVSIIITSVKEVPRYGVEMKDMSTYAEVPPDLTEVLR